MKLFDFRKYYIYIYIGKYLILENIYSLYQLLKYVNFEDLSEMVVLEN